jgi:catechol 1,2-dioxygenase
MSTDVRNETQLLCDIIGLESLVDEITYKLAADAIDQPTATAVLGPFWRKDAPKREMGDSVILAEMSQGDRTVCIFPLVRYSC